MANTYQKETRPSKGVDDISTSKDAPLGYGTAAPPPAVTAAAVVHRPWAFGLFDCLDDTAQCVDVTCCFYCKFGYMAHRLEKGDIGMNVPLVLMMALCNHFLGLQCAPGISYQFRKAIILRYGLQPESFCTMCWISLCCTGCAMCQQAREMEVANEGCGGICVKSPAGYTALR